MIEAKIAPQSADYIEGTVPAYWAEVQFRGVSSFKFRFNLVDATALVSRELARACTMGLRSNICDRWCCVSLSQSEPIWIPRISIYRGDVLSPNLSIKRKCWTMPMCIDHAKARVRDLLTAAAAFALFLALPGCSPQTETSA